MKKFIPVVIVSVLILCVGIDAKENAAGLGQLDWRELSKDIKTYSHSEPPVECQPDIISIEDFEKLQQSYEMFNRKTWKKFFVGISSSSSMTEKEVAYSAEKAVDGDLKTFWCEGKNDFGSGEWIKVKLETPKELKGKKEFESELIIFPGNGYSEKAFYENNRIRTAWLISRVKKPIRWMTVAHLYFSDCTVIVFT